jgi:predicted Rossmann fold flavoprotein
MSGERTTCDVAIVGAGAAGLMTAIVAARRAPTARVLLLDSAARPGAKILVSGGGRCNVTNTSVQPTDFWGGSRTIVRKILRALSTDATVAFFADLGVTLHEEEDGKLFPDSNRARDVLAALLASAGRVDVQILTSTRVTGVSRTPDDWFRLCTTGGDVLAPALVLATGGQSLPKTGSDGAGYAFARALGHTIVPTTPGLAPLLLDPVHPHSVHHALSGVSHDVTLTVWRGGKAAERLTGALLWTHFGISGPAALNASRHWARARLEDRPVRLTASFTPGTSFEQLDRKWVDLAASRPRASLHTAVASMIPDALAAAVLRALAIDRDAPLAQLARGDRRRIVHALLEWPLPVVDTRGYNYAEVTAGGVALDEIDPATMESRRCPGLYLVGEILDADGRLGGFNFQWAWATGTIAGTAVAAPRSRA